MSITKKIIIVLLIALACWAVWHFFIRMKQPVKPPADNNPPPTDNNPSGLGGGSGDGETPTDDPIGKVKSEDEGETTVNINYGADYRRNAVNNYYLIYRDFNGGAGQVIEITGTAYLQYMKDYPSGIAKGNVISKYKV